MIENKSKRIKKRNIKISYNKKSMFVIIPIFLISTLIFSNVAVSSKLYDLINCTKNLDSLKNEFKDLCEQKDVLVSPTRIREKATKDLGMVDIENINELLIIQP